MTFESLFHLVALPQETIDTQEEYIPAIGGEIEEIKLILNQLTEKEWLSAEERKELRVLCHRYISLFVEAAAGRTPISTNGVTPHRN